jgi:methyl-accepting chemotaxis protein
MFDIVQNKIQIKTEDLAIPPFKDYYNNAKNKSKALKNIEFIVWRYKWNSPYEAYPEKERTARVAKDVFNVDDYTPDSEIEELAKRFNEFQETPMTRLLKSSKNAAEGIMNTMDSYANAELDIDSAKKLASILKDVSGIIKSLDLAMKQAKAEQVETGRVKGGGVIGMYE